MVDSVQINDQPSLAFQISSCEFDIFSNSSLQRIQLLNWNFKNPINKKRNSATHASSYSSSNSNFRNNENRRTMRRRKSRGALFRKRMWKFVQYTATTNHSKKSGIEWGGGRICSVRNVVGLVALVGADNDWDVPQRCVLEEACWGTRKKKRRDNDHDLCDCEISSVLTS